MSLLTGIARQQAAVTAMEDALVVAQAVRDTRDWVNLPAADLRPPEFADAVAGRPRSSGAAPRCRSRSTTRSSSPTSAAAASWGSAAARPLRRGSSSSRTHPSGAVAHLALVGKGVTFDSGGLSIKTAGGMTTMKCDMAGAAAVVQATFAIARLGLPVKVSTFAPMAENMVSGSAMRPGDVITQYGGTTVEVLNTDAEGRLILADALVRATEHEARRDPRRRHPDRPHGHRPRRPGRRRARLRRHRRRRAGRGRGSRRGDVADAHPRGDRRPGQGQPDRRPPPARRLRWGGGLFAAAYLREFTADLPWAHLDIAGTAFNSGGAYGHITSGGTGASVTTLVEYAGRSRSPDVVRDGWCSGYRPPRHGRR